MSRPIAYNASGPLSGSIRGGSVNYTVDSGNRDYTTFASKKWVPSADGAAPIVFVTDTYTQGITNQATAVPLFYSCNGTGSAAIIYTANRIPGSPGNYTDANVALNDLITARGYFILESNDPFEGIDADNLVLDLDASKISSYPQVGTSWRDLSGNGNNGTLINGPTYNSLGVISFDNVDDYVQISSSLDLNALAATRNMTICFTAKKLFYGTGGNNFGNSTVLAGANNGYDSGFRITEDNGGTPGTAFNGTPSYGFGAPALGNGIGVTSPRTGQNTFSYVCFSQSGSSMLGFINGRFTTVTFTNAYTPGTNNGAIGRDIGAGVGWFGGYIGNFQIYNRALTQTEILQNYYQAPIVTDGLVLAVDPSNLVSYESGSTTTYSLTGSVSGSLLNGVGYLPSYGGAWNFDGVDDRIFTNTNLSISSSFTIEYAVLIKELPTTGEYNSIFFNGAGFRNNGVYAEFGDGPFFSICTVNSSSAAGAVYLSNPQANVLYYATATYENRTLKGYINGNLVNTNNLNFDPVNGSNNTLNIGAYGPFVIPFWRFYNKSLSAAEVQQNYQAEQYRFETPAGPVTNGLLLYLDAGNLDSYPGTGTTIYDLSGKGANGTLINGVGFNQTNGGVLIFDGVDDGVDGINVPQNYVDLMIGMYSEGDSGVGTEMVFAKYDDADKSFRTVGGVFRHSGIDGNDWNFDNTQYDYVNGSLISGNVNLTNNWNIVRLVNQNSSFSPPFVYSLSSDFLNRRYKGKIAFVLCYDRILTTAEVNQNYNYFKGRFGL
jgi:hypothetical protein